MKKIFLIILVCIITAANLQSASAITRVCEKNVAKQAETEVSTAKTWKQVYRYFKLYAHCDDGSIGEGFSEVISVLLAENWKDLPQLNSFIKADPSFNKFVIKHIDSTLPMDRLTHIANYTENQCPVSLKKLCFNIKVATSRAIQDQK